MNRGSRLMWVSAMLLATGFACVPAKRLTTGGVVPGQSVNQDAKILILPVADGVERADGPAASSGSQVYSAVRDALIAKGIQIVPTETSDLLAVFDQAQALGCKYLLKGVISEWEDNATEWSGKPDVAALSLELYVVSDKALAASATHRVTSSTVQGFSRKPDRFVPELVDQTLARIFGWAPVIVAPK